MQRKLRGKQNTESMWTREKVMRRSGVFSGRVTPKKPISGDWPVSTSGAMKRIQETAIR